MQYYVDGKVFDSPEQALAYENELKRRKNADKERMLKEYKDSVREKMRLYVLSEGGTKETYIAIVADSDWYKYARAIAEHRAGRQYVIENKKVKARWGIHEEKDSDVFESVLNDITYGYNDGMGAIFFSAVDIEKPDFSERIKVDNVFDLIASLCRD